MRITLAVMRIFPATARLPGMLLAILTVAVLFAPSAVADSPFRLRDYVTDNANVLSTTERARVQDSVDQLYSENRTRLWVVYVDSFSGRTPANWAQDTMNTSGFGDQDALLAVAVEDRAYYFQPPASMSTSDAASLRRNNIEPQLHDNNWTGAAVAAATGLNVASSVGSGMSWFALLIALAVLAVLIFLAWLWLQHRKGKRREAEFAAAKQVDPTDPDALAAVSLDALDDLSRVIVVDVDNAVRTSESELALAVEEFGTTQTEPFSAALADAKAALAQAFNVRQILDDASPETPLQQRNLLTRVIVAAAKADRALDVQSDAFEKLRDLLINAPTRLDALTQQMVALSARITPSEQTLAGLHKQFSDAALASIAGNVGVAKQRLAFADQNLSTARNLVSRPAGDQTGLIDAIRAIEGSLGQAQTLLDAVDSARSDINRAIAGLPAAVADIQSGIDQAAVQLAQPNTPTSAELSTARDAAVKAVADATSNGSTDPLGVFSRLTKADADLDRVLASIAEFRQEAEKQARMLEQALFTAQSRVKGVSDFIDTRRGSIGPEARTRLSEASRQLEAAEAKRTSNPAEAIAHANGASMLAAQAQTMANDDVNHAQRAYAGQYGGNNSDLGSMIGGIIIGSVLRGGFSGTGMGGSWGGGYGGGRSMGRPTSYGGSSHSSGRNYSGGGGGRF
ncbi:TPM domain-containing protein [soil metagenome]